MEQMMLLQRSQHVGRGMRLYYKKFDTKFGNRCILRC